VKDIGFVKAAGCWVLHARAREYHWQGSGQLSIKTFFGGRAHYRVGAGHHAVDESSYLVLNDGQSYAITIESPQPVESFSLFFDAGFAEDVQRTLSQKPEDILDEPDSNRIAPIRFFERNYSHDRILSPALFRLRTDYRNRERGWLVERLHLIVERLLKVHRKTCAETERLDSVRLATREELYRRVSRARDYISAMFAEPVTLPELARVACLSPNHLLRSFRKVFGAYGWPRSAERAPGLRDFPTSPERQVKTVQWNWGSVDFSTLFTNRQLGEVRWARVHPADFR